MYINLGLSRKVGGVNLSEWMEKTIREIGSHPKLVPLNLAKDTEALKLAANNLRACAKKVVDWNISVDFPAERSAFHSLLEAYMGAAKAVRRHYKAISQVADQLKAEHSEALRIWRKMRTRIQTFLTGKNVPESVAKVVADRIYAIIVPPASKGVKITLTDPLFDIAQGSLVDVLTQPIVFPYDAAKQDSEYSFHGLQLAKLYRNHQQTVVNKMREAVTTMNQGTPVPPTSIGCIDIPPEDRFVMNPSWLELDADPWVPKDLPEYRMAVWTSWTEQQVSSPAELPFRSMPSVLTQFVGTSVITIIDSGTVKDHGGEMQTWIASGDSSLLAKFPSVVMREGSSLWLPLGACPVICGCSMTIMNQSADVNLKERCVGVQRHAMAIGFTPILDPISAKAANEDLRRLVGAFVVRAWPTLPQTWKALMGPWREALQ